MKKIIILYSIVSLIGFNLIAQEIQIIELDAVEIIPTDELLIYSNFSKKHRENKVNAFGPGIRGKIAVVMGFLNPEKSSIQLDGLEFYFNYEWDQDSSGFYIQPVVVKEEDGMPMASYTDFSEKYLVTSKLKNSLYIDLSTKEISLSPNERVYVGIKFLENVNPKTPDIFNINAISGKILEYTYILYSDGSRPQEVVGPGKHSAGLKYSVVYKLKE
ncbi:MAG: hypothetical protein NWQ20_06295 [Algoriphagus sp.]|uniref:hypothetical protein n=1 Tax=Algoriphagus sp. TaxID=1872435 RepID=UPI0027729F3E|nr:hypothetical protein [Algoriphagus sp.]